MLAREWKLVFERAKRVCALTPGEIEDIARDTYGSLLEAMATIPPGEGDLAGAIDAIENAIEDEEWEEADRTMQRKGIKVEKDTPTYAALAQAILTAKLEAMYGARRAMRGQATGTPAAFTPHGIDPRTLQPRVRETAPPNLATTPRAPAIKLRGGVGFLEASERFLAERQRDPKAKRREHSLQEHQRAFRLFEDHSNDAPLVAIDRKMAAGFIDTVATLSPKWG